MMTNAMTEQTFSIGELCQEFDVTPRTLRFYEYKELLAPIRDGQRRLFTVRDRARLKLILRGKRFGFSLAEIKDLLDLYHLGDGQVTQLSATLETAERHRAELISKREELDAAIKDLDQQVAVAQKMLAQRSGMRAAE